MEPNSASTMVTAERRAVRRRWLVAGLLAGSLALNAIPFWWGAGPHQSWAFDEVTPTQVLGVRTWPAKYPPLFRTLNRAVLVPLERVEMGPRLGWNRHETLHIYLLIMRLMSVGLGTATVWLVYRIGQRIGGWRTGLLSGAAIALSPSFAYYAKMANLDALQLFLFAASVLAVLRWLETRTFGSIAAMTLLAAATIAAKTSAAALYVFWPIALLLPPRWSSRVDEGAKPPHLLRDWRPWTALLIGAGALMLFFHWPHVMTLEEHRAGLSHGATSAPADWPNTLGGHAGLLTDGLEQWAYVLSLPLSLVAVAGLALLARRRERRTVALLIALTAISNYAFFIALVRFQAERYYLPVALLAAVTAGYALDRLLATRPRVPVAAGLLVALLFTWPATRVVAVDLLMLSDTRYDVERWLSMRADAGSALAIGRFQYLPRGTSVWPWHRLGRNRCDRLEAAEPSVLLVSPDDTRSEGERNTLRLLLDSYSGFARLQTFPRPSWFDRFIPRHSVTNLEKLTPTVVVLAPTGGPCQDRRWAMQSAGELLGAANFMQSARLTSYLLDYWDYGHRFLLPDRAVASGLDQDAWTYGAAPAALALTNPTAAAWRPRVELLGYVASADDPQPVRLSIDGVGQELVLQGRRWRRLELAPLAPGERRLIVLQSDRFGRPSPGSEKQFGVRLRVVR